MITGLIRVDTLCVMTNRSTVRLAPFSIARNVVQSALAEKIIWALKQGRHSSANLVCKRGVFRTVPRFAKIIPLANIRQIAIPQNQVAPAMNWLTFLIAYADRRKGAINGAVVLNRQADLREPPATESFSSFHSRATDRPDGHDKKPRRADNQRRRPGTLASVGDS